METARNTLCGWELNNPDTELFDTRIENVCGSCKECEHLHECTVPSESMRCLVPKAGELIELHSGRAEGGENITYFALLHADEVKFIQLSQPEHYWAKALCVGREEVPQPGLTLLDRRVGESPGGSVGAL